MTVSSEAYGLHPATMALITSGCKGAPAAQNGPNHPGRRSPWQVAMDDMSMRPNAKTGSPGKTYRFYNKNPTFVFGHGLSYVSWKLVWGGTMPAASQSVAALTAGLSFPVTGES